MITRTKLTFLTLMGLAIYLVLLAYGCAAHPEIKLTHSWKNPNYPVHPLNRIIIIGKPETADDRVSFENVISFELDKHGVMTIPGYTVIPDPADINFENLTQSAKETGVPAVLVIKFVNEHDKKVVFTRKVSSGSNAAADDQLTLESYLKDSPVDMRSTLRLEAGLFDAGSGRLLWGASSSETNQDLTDPVIKDFIRQFVDELVTDGFVKPAT
jgi:hypothetical protein